MTTPEALLRGLLEPLLDARRQPATEHFDETLGAALGAGRITPELARELRFWQRASVHEVSDHVRTVLPAVLPVVLAAVDEAVRDADEAAAGALAAWADREDRTPSAEADSPAEVTLDVTDEVTLDLTDEAAVGVSDAAIVAVVGEPPASTPPQDGAAMSPHVRRRLFVAGLTSTA